MFAHGQLYVALSRVSRWTDLRIWQHIEDQQDGDSDDEAGYEVVNPVFTSILN